MTLEGFGDHTPEIRASDAEREYVVDVLRGHCGAGRIDLDEFSERINKVYAARTIGELNDITSDLPVLVEPSDLAVSPGKVRRASRWIVAVMSGAPRKGKWRVDPETNVIAFMGGADLDLRDAVFSGDEIFMRLVAVMGGINIIVPEGMEVHADGIPFMGGFDDKTDASAPPLRGAPVLRIKYFAMWGGISVRSKTSPQEEAARRDARRQARSERRDAMRGGHDHRSDARREVHDAIQQAKLEAIQQAREATKRALASIPDWFPQPPVPPAAPAPAGQQAKPAPAARPAATAPTIPNLAPEGTVTLLVTDIEGSTSMTEEMGDIRWMRVLNKHNEQVRTCVHDHGGIELKQQGDGFLLAFPSARRALLCAVSLQKTFHDDEMPVRMGLHTGEVIREGDDLYGRNVILASRIASEAHGGEILVSSLTKELTDSSGDLEFSDNREVELKGLNGTFRVWTLAWKS